MEPDPAGTGISHDPDVETAEPRTASTGASADPMSEPPSVAPAPTPAPAAAPVPTPVPAPESTETRYTDHDSLVTVRLSEPPTLHVNTSLPMSLLPSRRSLYGNEYTPTDAMAEIVHEEKHDDEGSEGFPTPTPASKLGKSLQDELDDGEEPNEEAEEVPDEEGEEESGGEEEAKKEIEKEEEERGAKLEEESTEEDKTEVETPRNSSESEEVNWEQLQKSEDQESKVQDSDNSTAMLLARLEQENNKLATNPKSIKVQVVETRKSAGRRPRPPSMAQLRQMVHGPTPSSLRYSLLPPPPMTDLEFYLALVKDYRQTAARLPTLLSNKIRKGIPPPLRGIVWQSMSGARDSILEEAFDRLSGESSPYEGIIGKDLNRSFPGVEMFMDPEGEGQRMLGRVLKCFSLYDDKIGYCQGLAFLVGPLLMHMPDKQAFCVLVKLMEIYDLRHCFVPDLSGLHVRIYQFRELLGQFLPTLSNHLDELQVDPAYVSQWFLSFFAVTCPLPMLFRIYDVVFAEGASETVMRVALSLMRKNETRILACTEMEDILQLLLSRGLWDCYHYNADEFVDDFVSLSDVVTRERLSALEQAYREEQIARANPKTTTPNAAAEVTTAAAASTFLGRLWSGSTPILASLAPLSLPSPIATTTTATATATTTNNTAGSTLSPGLTVVPRPLSMLRRSASKQSIASTLNSMEAASSTTSSSAASVLSSASTEATFISRDSHPTDELSRESPPTAKLAVPPTGNRSGGSRDDEKYLHSQIEDLLSALTELQRNNALLASQLQKEREDRGEDKKAVRSLLDGLRKKASGETEAVTGSPNAGSPGASADGTAAADRKSNNNQPTAEQLSDLLDNVESRFASAAESPRSSTAHKTKSELQDELARAKDQLVSEATRTQACNRRIAELEQEVAVTKEQLRESHTHVRNVHTEKQRLEKQLQGMRTRSSDTPPSSSLAEAGEWLSKATGLSASAPTAAVVGLRELKLGRSKSTPSQTPGSLNKRSSSAGSKVGLRDSAATAPPHTAPVGEHEALLIELIHAKTAEAVARQEAEEWRLKLENLRKAFGLAPGDTPLAAQSTAASQASAAASAAMGMLSRFTGSSTNPAPVPNAAPASAPAASAPAPAAAVPAQAGNTASGGFWGWRR